MKAGRYFDDVLEEGTNSGMKPIATSVPYLVFRWADDFRRQFMQEIRY